MSAVANVANDASAGDAGGWPAVATVAWIAAGLLAAILQIVAIERQSLIGDAPMHLLAGEQAVRYGQNRLNFEHPPLVKMLAALPLLAEAPLAPPTTIAGSLETSRRVFDDPARLRRVMQRARAILLVCFALPLLAACYTLGRMVGGRRAGTVLSLAIGLAFPLLPFLAVIQTDTAVTLGFVLTVIAALRYAGSPSRRAALLLGAAFGLALAAKFSGLLLLPTILLAVTLARRQAVGRRLADLALALATAAAIVATTYAVANRDYDPTAGREAIATYCRGEAMVVGDLMRPFEPGLERLERWSPAAAQWLTGLIGIGLQNRIGIYPSYAFGSVDSRGRWWYFPALILVKTPIALLAASALALLARIVKRRRLAAAAPRAGSVLLVVTVAVYLGVAISSNYNIGVRHLMPVLPLLYLPAAVWAGARPVRAMVLVGVLALEAAALAPLWMSATNTWWLGSYNPTRFSLSNADNDYEQNFLVLAEETRARGIEHLHVLYPPLPEKQIRAYIPGADTVRAEAALDPGWYAVSVRMDQFIPALLGGDPRRIHGYQGLRALAERWEPSWRSIASGEDHGYLAGTFHLYRLTARVEPGAASKHH